jgi:hypothetical protein
MKRFDFHAVAAALGQGARFALDAAIRRLPDRGYRR